MNRFEFQTWKYVDINERKVTPVTKIPEPVNHNITGTNNTTNQFQKQEAAKINFFLHD